MDAKVVSLVKRDGFDSRRPHRDAVQHNSILTGGANESLEPVWDDGEFVVSRATHTNGRGPMLVVTPALAQPSPASLAQLEHASALRDELDSSWAARPVELIRR